MKLFGRFGFLGFGICATIFVAACAQESLPASEVSATVAESQTTVEPGTDTLSGAQEQVRIEGHRGARGLKPENTLPSFEAALDVEVAVLELDLHLSSDDQLVIWHDDELEADKCRLTQDAPDSLADPASGDGVPIRELQIDDLQYYQCDINPDPERFPEQDNDPTVLAGNNYQLLTLPELFDFVEGYATSAEKSAEQRANAASVEFNIETKRDPSGRDNIGDGFDGTAPGRFEIQLLAAIEAAGVGDRAVIQSFDHRSLWSIRSLNPDIRLAALSSRNVPDLEELANSGAAIWSPDFRRISAELIDEAHALGLLVIPWTVNEANDMTRLLDLGVDGIITDRPDIGVGLP